MRSSRAIWGRGAAAVAARRGWAGLRRRDFGAGGGVAPMCASTGLLTWLAHSGRRRIVRRLLPPHRGEVVLRDVIPDHALGREPRTRGAQRVPHLLRPAARDTLGDRKSTRLNSSHTVISYAVFCLKKKNTNP